MQTFQFTTDQRMVITMALSAYRREIRNSLATESRAWQNNKEIFAADLKHVDAALLKLNQLDLPIGA